MFKLKCLFSLLTTKYSILITAFYILNSAFYICTAEVRYVSTTGNNIPPYLTWEDAANSIQDAINVCVNGDTIYVANGVYKENLVINTEIALIGSSMDSTVIDGRGLGEHTIILYASGSLENFNILGRGFGLSGAAIRNLQSISFIKIKNCQISETSVGIAFFNSSVSAENVLMKNLIRGFDLASVNPFSYNISDCTIILMHQDSQGIRIGFASEATAYLTNNIILFTGTPQVNYGISIGAPKKVYIENNLISGFGDNIFFDTVVDTAFIMNNVLTYQTGGGPAASIWSSGNRIFTTNTVLSKNLRGIYQAGSGFIRSDYNLFWKNNIDITGISYGDSDRVADPMFIKDTLPNPQLDFDYHLQAYSPAIDAGNPDILDVDGSRSDIGMFGGPLGEKYTYMDLAPKPPANLTAVYQSNSIHLNWNKNTEADLSRYRIYRDTVPNFIYDISKMIGETEDTTFTDILPDPNKAKNYYYKITAFDNQENQSAASEEVHIIVTGLGEIPPQVVEEYKLLNNYPNPFNPSTTIPYRLKEAGYVKVMVYNILGELVRVLVNQWQEKGYYEVVFSPNVNEKVQGKIGSQGLEFETGYYGNIVSGIYLLRIEIIGEGKIPRFSDMQKMMLVK